MDTEIKAGDWVTWGTKTWAYKVLEVNAMPDKTRLGHERFCFTSHEFDEGEKAGLLEYTDELEVVEVPYVEGEPEEDASEQSQPDVVVKPAHYSGFFIEPVTFIMRNGLPFWKGNVIKYVCRAGLKLYDGMDVTQSEITDLKKTIRYAEMRINQLEGEVTL